MMFVYTFLQGKASHNKNILWLLGKKKSQNIEARTVYAWYACKQFSKTAISVSLFNISPEIIYFIMEFKIAASVL